MNTKRRRYLMKERQKRNRFMGWVLILIMLLFILPTFNLAQSYQQLLQRRQQLADLQTQYKTLSDERIRRQHLLQVERRGLCCQIYTSEVLLF